VPYHGFHLGDFTTARTRAEQTLSFSPPKHAIRWTADPQILVRTYLFKSLARLGYLGQGCLRRGKALTQASQDKHAFTLAVVFGHALRCDTELQSDPAILLKRAEELTALCDENGFPTGVQLRWSFAPRAPLRWERVEEALPLFDEALATYQRVGTVLY
jgi:hypothetical protein